MPILVLQLLVKEQDSGSACFFAWNCQLLGTSLNPYVDRLLNDVPVLH